MFIRSPKELAMIVINQRKKLKLSQSEVGKLVGLKQQTVSNFELYPQNTELDTLFRILSAVNLDIKTFARNEKTISKWNEEW